MVYREVNQWAITLLSLLHQFGCCPRACRLLSLLLFGTYTTFTIFWYLTELSQFTQAGRRHTLFQEEKWNSSLIAPPPPTIGNFRDKIGACVKSACNF